MNEKFILDACCGGKQFWFNKNHPNVLYIDIRKEEKGILKSKFNFDVNPDIVMDFRKMDFPDKSFKLIVWDPPHLTKLGKTSIYIKKYGILGAESWPYDLKQGFNECWRVLDDYGVLVFKWSDSEIPLKKVLKLFKEKPLIGQRAGTRFRHGSCIWLCFMKIPEAVRNPAGAGEGK